MSAGGELDPVKDAFEEFARRDPMYAALTRSGREDRGWDPDEFFAVGREEIATVLEYVEALRPGLARDRALDFGCAIGRLTQALGDHFEEVVGVDIAEGMADAAREHNRHADRVQYRVNTRPDLALFEDGSFDFVYTNKVLQHIPPRAQLSYIREFMRVLRPGGVAVLQTRNGPRFRFNGPRGWLYTLNRRHLRRALQRLRGRAPYEMHYVARSRVEDAVREAGGRVVDVADLSRGKPQKSLRYCALRTP
jgi:2-polyprenyl-3-methyl-5-hydroxy-6-metoxy-1,4-benzoquinol methylase